MRKQIQVENLDKTEEIIDLKAKTAALLQRCSRMQQEYLKIQESYEKKTDAYSLAGTDPSVPSLKFDICCITALCFQP